MNRDVEMVTEARLPRGPMLLRSACQLSRFLNIGCTNMPPLLNPPGERYLPSICAANTSVTDVRLPDNLATCKQHLQIRRPAPMNPESQLQQTRDLGQEAQQLYCDLHSHGRMWALIRRSQLQTDTPAR